MELLPEGPGRVPNSKLRSTVRRRPASDLPHTINNRGGGMRWEIAARDSINHLWIVRLGLAEPLLPATAGSAAERRCTCRNANQDTLNVEAVGRGNLPAHTHLGYHGPGQPARDKGQNAAPPNR